MGGGIWSEPCFDSEGRLSFKVHHRGKPEIKGTVSRRGAVCARCKTPVPFPYIREQGQAGKLSAKMMGIVAEGKRGKIFLTPDAFQVDKAKVERPKKHPDAALPYNPRDFKTPNYGMRTFASLFTDRQLLMLTSLVERLAEIEVQIVNAAIKRGWSQDATPLAKGGAGAKAYAEAIRVYLAFVIDKLTDYHCSICSWHVSRETITHLFARQAIPMTWDYVEGNPFSSSTGSFDNMLSWVIKNIEAFPEGPAGVAMQADAQRDNGLRNIMVSTDPPYYDNVNYGDLADFFYIWMRASLQEIYPEVFRTMLAPKDDELIVAPYRFDGDKQASKEFFESGMHEACHRIYNYARPDIPVTFYYAYKQEDVLPEDENGASASSGWETMLAAIVNSGFVITGTWPLRTEMANRTVAQKTNALASSIVLVCRKRDPAAAMTTRRDFVRLLRQDLPAALSELTASNIAPVDLAQSAIGPGMAIFSRYDKVLEADGTPMTIRKALHAINRELDHYFNEQDGAIDAESSFCVALYSQAAYAPMAFGEADMLARAKNSAMGILQEQKILLVEDGKVHLQRREALPQMEGLLSSMKKFGTKGSFAYAQYLARAMQLEGIGGCAKLILASGMQDYEAARRMAYRLFKIADQKHDQPEAFAFNSLVSAWPQIMEAVQDADGQREQMDLFEASSSN